MAYKYEPRIGITDDCQIRNIATGGIAFDNEPIVGIKIEFDLVYDRIIFYDPRGFHVDRLLKSSGLILSYILEGVIEDSTIISPCVWIKDLSNNSYFPIQTSSAICMTALQQYEKYKITTPACDLIPGDQVIYIKTNAPATYLGQFTIAFYRVNSDKSGQTTRRLETEKVYAIKTTTGATIVTTTGFPGGLHKTDKTTAIDLSYKHLLSGVYRARITHYSRRQQIEGGVVAGDRTVKSVTMKKADSLGQYFRSDAGKYDAGKYLSFIVDCNKKRYTVVYNSSFVFHTDMISDDLQSVQDHPSKYQKYMMLTVEHYLIPQVEWV